MVKMAANPADRAKFVQSVVAFVKQYNFDGSVGKIRGLQILFTNFSSQRILKFLVSILTGSTHHV